MSRGASRPGDAAQGASLASVPKPWPRVSVSTHHDGEVEYKAERPRSGDERTSYMLAMPSGLLLGRAWRAWHPARLSHPWFCEGWTPRADGYVFGPFTTRWEAMGCLYQIEEAIGWPHRSLIHRSPVGRAA